MEQFPVRMDAGMLLSTASFSKLLRAKMTYLSSSIEQVTEVYRPQMKSWRDQKHQKLRVIRYQLLGTVMKWTSLFQVYVHVSCGLQFLQLCRRSVSMLHED